MQLQDDSNHVFTKAFADLPPAQFLLLFPVERYSKEFLPRAERRAL
jgi:hypothetical protein